MKELFSKRRSGNMQNKGQHKWKRLKEQNDMISKKALIPLLK